MERSQKVVVIRDCRCVSKFHSVYPKDNSLFKDVLVPQEQYTESTIVRVEPPRKELTQKILESTNRVEDV